MSKIQFMQEGKRVKLVATDLDGTLLKDDKTISESDLATLEMLGGKGVVRVAATGRSLHKVNEVLHPGTPFDYIIFSSGAGIYDWKKKQLLANEHFEAGMSLDLCEFLVNQHLNFLVFDPIPHNNLFLYNKVTDNCSEFNKYLDRHAGDYSPLDIKNYSVLAGQFMAILPNDESVFLEICDKLNSSFEEISVIRTTSPVDQNYLWLEIFPATVSKGHGIRWLCDYLGVDYEDTACVGNDFNDIDMLNFVKSPFVLGNSPTVLQQKYQSVEATNNHDGFTSVVARLFA